MGYYIRILGRNLDALPLEDLQQMALPSLLESDEGVSGSEWSALILKHRSGTPIAAIEKNPVVEGTLGFDELREFVDEVSYYKPDSAAAWLQDYLNGVKTIYAFQLMSGTEIDDGFALVHRVYEAIWSHAGGILQADQEGFTNERGNTILWQFSDHVTGEWNAAVLGPNGQWIDFEMDLGNRAHRESFWRGEMPAGAKLLL